MSGMARGMENSRGAEGSSRGIAGGLDRLAAELRDMRVSHAHEISGTSSSEVAVESHAENSYSQAVSRCRHGRNDPDGVRHGNYDKHIRTLLLRHLAGKYAGTADEIEQRAQVEHGVGQLRSLARIAVGDLATTGAVGITASIAPKIATLGGLKLAALSSSIPLIGGALSTGIIPAAMLVGIASPLIVARLVGRSTRVLRENRTAARILNRAMDKGGEEIKTLRNAIARGADIEQAFIEMLKNRSILEKLGSGAAKVLRLGAMTVGALTLGAVGAGGIDKAAENFWQKLVNEGKPVLAVGNDWLNDFPWFDRGVREWQDFIKHFTSYATAAVGAGPAPDTDAIWNRFARW